MYLVLEDDLFEEYIKFISKKDYDINIIKNILYYYKKGFIFTDEQLNKAEEIIDGFDKSQFITGFVSIGYQLKVSLEELAKQTKLKLILSKDKKDFPYVCISGDKIENNITSTYKKEESRQKAKNHLKALLESSKYILVYDKYLDNNFNNFNNFINDCFPVNAKITLECSIEKQKNKTQIKKINQNIAIKSIKANSEYKKLHDRYILIDNKIEVILTSGIDYLYDINKDFTYLIRLKQ